MREGAGELPSRRPYDARARRARAADERAATRTRVLAAAAELFVEHGYARTTIAAVAERADVAIQSIYAAVGGKPSLLVAAVTWSMRGDESHALPDQSWVEEVRAEDDPKRQIDLMTQQFRRIQERALPLWIVRQSAADQPIVAAHIAEDQVARLQTMRRLACLIGPSNLRPGLDHAAAADLLWTIVSPEVVALLHEQRGWSFRDIQRWSHKTLTRLLLA